MGSTVDEKIMFIGKNRKGKHRINQTKNSTSAYKKGDDLMIKNLFATAVVLTIFVMNQGLAGAAVTIDGDPSDWTGELPLQLHDDNYSNNEWIYMGEAGDRRTETGMTDNNDIVEVRMTRDTTNLYFLYKMADIDETHAMHIMMSLDRDGSNDDLALDWLGDDSNIELWSPLQYSEMNLDLHWTGSEWSIELYSDEGSEWIEPPSGQEEIAVSVDNDVVEFSIPLDDLGFTGGDVVRFSTATAENQGDWNNDSDTTVPFDTCDGVDVAGGFIGVHMDAASRDLGDGNVNMFFTVFFNELNMGEVLINDVMYNPEGPDEGYQWVELYNTTASDINISGWYLETAGAAFDLAWQCSPTAPVSIPPNGYILIAEPDVDVSSVPPSTIIMNSTPIDNFVSADDYTCGIRLMTTRGQLVDTLLYGSPNTYEHTNDLGEIAEYPAFNVLEGSSLARCPNGIDTNYSGNDFSEERWFALSLGFENNCAAVPAFTSLGILLLSITLSFALYKRKR